jgi:hypothetical protein
VVQSGDLASEMHWVTEVVVDHKGTQTNPRGRARDRGEGSERRPVGIDVIEGVDHVEAGGLCGDRFGE